MIFSDIAGENGIFCDGDWIEKKDQDPNGEVRLIQLADIGAGEFLDKSNRFVSNATAESLNCTLLHEGDLLISRLGEPLCKACIFPLEGKFITAVDVAILRINSAKVDARYLLYLINSPWFKERIKKYESGTTRKRISRKNLDRIEMQFPAVSEQHRIVSRIEELFSELDNSLSTLQKTKEQLTVYRQAVYSTAFDGIDDYVPISKHFDITSGLTKNSNRKQLSIKMPYLRVANVYYDRLDLDEIKTIGVTEEEIIRTTLLKDDLLFVEGNGSKSQIGRVAIWDGSIPNCLHQNHIIKGRSNGTINPRFALYYLISGYGRKQIQKVSSSTSGLYTLSANKVRSLVIPECNEKKQHEVVSEIESRLSVCDSIEQAVDTALQQAEAMRQSILKQAFEGRL